MSQATPRPTTGAQNPATPETRSSSARSTQTWSRPFFGILDSVLVEDPIEFAFDGALSREHADAVWTWVRRDVAANLIDASIAETDPAAAQVLDAAMPQVLQSVREAIATASASAESQRRLKAQLGGDEVWARLPFILGALKNRALLDKARSFGRAVNAIQDEAMLVPAMQSMPLTDANAAALLMQAAVGQVAQPSRMMTAVIRITGDSSEGAIRRAGYAPLVDALLAHAQNQIHVLSPMGAFADIDLTCRTVDRFHRLLRSVSGYIEVERQGRWSQVIATLTKRVSERLEQKLREVTPDVNQALRRPAQGVDRLDSDRMLSALNGLYLLCTIRDCRDSLAVNALFDQAWNQVGEALEMHITRNLDFLRANPGDKNTSARIDAAIKMAELRFNAEYADVLRRARDSAERRSAV